MHEKLHNDLIWKCMVYVAASCQINGYTALVFSHFIDQWECQTLVNQSIVMMHLSGEVMGEVMDIYIMRLENSQLLFGFCRF